MAMKPDAGVATPKGNGKPLEEISIIEPARSAIALPREQMVWIVLSYPPPSVSDWN